MCIIGNKRDNLNNVITKDGPKFSYASLRRFCANTCWVGNRIYLTRVTISKVKTNW